MSNLLHGESLDLIAHLSRVHLFTDIKEQPGALKELALLVKVRKFHRGSFIISEGQTGEEFFVLVEGQVSIFKSNPDGDQFKVAILKSESTPALGEGGLIESDTRSASVICDQECVCLVLTGADFRKFCAEHPEWAVSVLMKISMTLMGRLRSANQDITLLYKALMNELRST